LFPGLCTIVARCPRRLNAALILLCLAVLSIVNHASIHGLNLTFADSLWRFFPEFIAGIISARILPEADAKMPYRWLVAAAIGIIIAALLSAADAVAAAGLWLLIFGLASQASAGRPAIFGALKPLRFLGLLSYAFYMSFATIELVLAQLYGHERWNPAAHKITYALAFTLLTFGLALTLHNFVEKPSRRLIDGWLQPQQPLAVGSIRL
jgi:peptidoglycan/LPS O-acetylase OafA/YrhL